MNYDDYSRSELIEQIEEQSGMAQNTNDILRMTSAELGEVGKQLSASTAALAEISKAAQAVIDRWETPLWKNAEPTAEAIYALRDALAASNPNHP